MNQFTQYTHSHSQDLHRPSVIQYCLKRTHHCNHNDGVNVKTARFEDEGMFFLSILTVFDFKTII